MRIVSSSELPESESSSRAAATSNAASAQIQANQAATRASQNAAQSSAQNSISFDTLQLSDLGTKLSSVPGIRQEKVAAVSAQVQTGTYAVSNQQIAESMIRDFRMSGAPAQ